jgi:hypothetical protein
MKRIEVEQLAAELSAINGLLANLSEDDLAGRMGLEYKRNQIQAQLDELRVGEQHTASVALYFGGKPVIGGLGIEVGFASGIVATYQELVSKVWAIEGGMLAARGPLRQQEASTLHITSVVHGSFGFLLEELDERGEPLFESPLKTATDKASALLDSFGSEDEQKFAQALESVSPRVFSSVRQFFSSMHRDDAVCRLVGAETETVFDAAAVERAYNRVETSDVAEDEMAVEGELLGVIPVARRFEFRATGGELIRGGIGPDFGESYLVRIHEEQLVGKRWRAVIRRRETKRAGGTVETCTLMDLRELDQP